MFKRFAALVALVVICAFACQDNPIMPPPSKPPTLNPPIIVLFSVLPETSQGPASVDISFLIGHIGPREDLEIKITRDREGYLPNELVYWYPPWQMPEWTTWAGKEAAQLINFNRYTSTTTTYRLSASNNDGSVMVSRTVTVNQ